MNRLDSEQAMEVAQALMGKGKSEFGKGFVQNLLYFTKHFGRHEIMGIRMAESYVTGAISFEAFKESYPTEAVLLGIHQRVANKLDVSEPIWLLLNGASDHLYDMVIPEKCPDDMKARVNQLRDIALEMGHGFDRSKCTLENFEKMLDLLNDIARDIDFYYFNVICDRGENT